MTNPVAVAERANVPSLPTCASLAAGAPPCAAKYEPIKEANQSIFASPYFRGGAVNCDEDEGTLILRGRVRSYFLKQMAQEAVRKISGVRTIVNLIEVSQK